MLYRLRYDLIQLHFFSPDNFARGVKATYLSRAMGKVRINNFLDASSNVYKRVCSSVGENRLEKSKVELLVIAALIGDCCCGLVVGEKAIETALFFRYQESHFSDILNANQNVWREQKKAVA